MSGNTALVGVTMMWEILCLLSVGGGQSARGASSSPRWFARQTVAVLEQSLVLHVRAIVVG